MNIGKYSKLIAYVVGAALTVLSQRYGSTDWLPYVVAAAGALGVYAVPNTTPAAKKTPAPPAAPEPAAAPPAAAPDPVKPAQVPPAS